MPIASVPDRMIDEIHLVGPKEKVRDELAAWRESRVTTMLIGGSPDMLRLARPRARLGRRDDGELGATSTTDDVLEGVDLTGKRAIVTGASTGLGEETTRALAAHGVAVTMAVRDIYKGEQAAARIRSVLPNADLPDLHLDIRQLELGSLASVRAFAAGFLADHDRLDLLILNAGVMACPYMTTDDGFELQFGTNHLGHFLLAELLTPALVAAAPPRVVSLSSGGHRIADVDLDDPGFEHTEYSPWVGYGRPRPPTCCSRWGSRSASATRACTPTRCTRG